MKRLFDVLFSVTFLVILFPFFLIIALIIKSDSGDPVFYRQQRVGLNGGLFKIFKFRTMYVDSDKAGELTVGGRDPRVTASGYLLRKYKLDELPQLINVFIGHMSVVGPRPEVPRYVELYNEEQKAVLKIKPGITDYASIIYANENELLASSNEPEKTYIEEIMPAKLQLNLKYIADQSFLTDLKIIFQTIKRIVIR